MIDGLLIDPFSDIEPAEYQGPVSNNLFYSPVIQQLGDKFNLITKFLTFCGLGTQ